MSLYERGNTWHFAFRWNGNRYRGSCKTSKKQEAKKVESLVLARLLARRRSPAGKQEDPDASRLLESLLQLVGIFAGKPSAETVNP